MNNSRHFYLDLHLSGDTWSGPQQHTCLFFVSHICLPILEEWNFHNGLEACIPDKRSIAWVLQWHLVALLHSHPVGHWTVSASVFSNIWILIRSSVCTIETKFRYQEPKPRSNYCIVIGAKTFFANFFFFFSIFFFSNFFFRYFILLWGTVLKNLKLNKKYSKNQFGMIEKNTPYYP